MRVPRQRNPWQSPEKLRGFFGSRILIVGRFAWGIA